MTSLLLLTLAAGIDEARLDELRARFEKFVKDGEASGVVLAVGTKDRVHTIAVGSRSLDPAEGMKPNSIFRIASMTKPMVGAAIQALIDEGKLKADDPVEKHLPEFKGQMVVAEQGKDRLVLVRPKRPITLRDLLTHTSGMPPYPPGLANVYLKRDRSLAEAVLAVSQRPLLFEPGSRWAYSNPGIDTLGRVVEAVSGQEFESFMQQRLFTPLGMKDATFRPTPDQAKRAAHLHGSKGGKLFLAPDTLLGPPEKSRHPIPAGGLYASALDVARFYQMMLNGGELGGKRVLTEEGVKEATRCHTGDLKCGFTPGMGFGHGFAVVREPQGVTALLSRGSFGHGGAFGTQSWADPEKGVFLILMVQRTGLANGDASDLRSEMQRILLEPRK
jgi:CubicO group peptidase (beta-lactamase class C family)